MADFKTFIKKITYFLTYTGISELKLKQKLSHKHFGSIPNDFIGNMVTLESAFITVI